MTHHVLMYLPFPYIYGAMFGWDVPSRVDPLREGYVSLLTLYIQTRVRQ